MSSHRAMRSARRTEELSTREGYPATLGEILTPVEAKARLVPALFAGVRDRAMQADR